MILRARRAAATTLALAVGVAWTAAPASAGVITKGARSTTTASGLIAAERRAISVKSVTTSADDSLGLVVTVQFRGDIERYLGQGGLENGLLALVLVPRSRGTTSGGVIDQGGGITRRRIRMGTKRATVDLLAPDKVTAVNTRARVRVIRAASKVIFYVADRAVGRIAKVNLKVFARGARAATSRPARARLWRQILARRPAAEATVAVDPSRLSGDEMDALHNDLAKVGSSVIGPELRRQQRARARLRPLAIAPLGIGQLRSELATLDILTGRLRTLLRSWSPSVEVFQTAPGLSQFMTSRPALAMSSVRAPGLPVINVDPTVAYQRFDGVGAAMTDSSAWLIDYQLADDRRMALMHALFGTPDQQNPLGVPPIHLSFLRVAIGASGAMTVGAPYTYDDMPPGQSDPSLSAFSIAHDSSYMIPTLQQALAVNPALQILANPWSPPAWMKGNHSLDNLGGRGTVLESAYGPLASYIVKFIDAYERQGIPIAGVTPQNEPSSGGSGTPYPGMTLPEPDEDRFIAQNLGPALRAAGLNTRVYANDHNWDQQSYAQGIATGAAAGEVAGIAWHCYFGSPSAMSVLHRNAPDLDQIVDECSPEIRSFGTPEFLISSLRNWARLVSVWSVALDPSGGPIQAPNDCRHCTGPVTIDPQTQKITFRPEYYQLGQVSAFVQPGAQRIASTSFVGYGQTPSHVESITSGLDDVAFENPDGSKVLVAYNNSRAPISFDARSSGRHFTYTIPARAMTTFTWQ